MPIISAETRKTLKRRLARGLAWVRRRVPPGLRSVMGLFLIAGGLFGFLPVLGFWMIPLGIGIVWLDVRAWRRMRTGRGRASPGS